MRYIVSIMCVVRSMVLVVCAANAIDGDLRWRRYLMDQGPIRFGPGGAIPGGDPLHQGGNVFSSPHYKQGQCVTQENPCRCSMTYAVSIGCLRCNCGHSFTAALTRQPTTGQPSAPSTTIDSLSTTTSPVTMSTKDASTTPTTTIATTTTKPTPTTIDYCDVAKQLCQGNCPDGYLVDPGDCTFCMCKKDALAG